jgi:glycosyltransferase involved in cell wall biosynthesis
LYNSVVRVLLLNLYYPPDTSATAKMAKTVVTALAAKHQVTILCGRPSYDPTERFNWHLYQNEEAGSVRVIRVGSTDYPRVQMKKRIFNYLSYVLLAVPRAFFLPCDVILAMTDPPFEGIVGAFVALVRNKPYVYNIRDMYPDMAVGGDIVQRGKFVQTWESMHRWALRKAARVIVLGDDMRDRIMGKGIAPDRVVIVRDGATFPASLPSTSDSIVQEIRCGFPFVALHAGNLGFYGAWDTLLKAAEILRNENSGLVFIGDGANRERLASAATQAGASNVKFLPFRPFEQVQHVMMAGDVHVVTIRRGLEGVVVPSKLYGILAAGRPVLVVANAKSDAARIVVDSGCGLTADPDDPQGVANAIRELRSDPQRLSEMGTRARAAAGKYARVNELQRFSAILEEAVEASK